MNLIDFRLFRESMFPYTITSSYFAIDFSDVLTDSSYLTTLRDRLKVRHKGQMIVGDSAKDKEFIYNYLKAAKIYLTSLFGEWKCKQQIHWSCINLNVKYGGQFRSM